MKNGYWTSILVSHLYCSDILSGSSRPGQVGNLAALGFSSHKLCPLCQEHAYTDTHVHNHTLTLCVGCGALEKHRQVSGRSGREDD